AFVRELQQRAPPASRSVTPVAATRPPPLTAVAAPALPASAPRLPEPPSLPALEPSQAAASAPQEPASQLAVAGPPASAAASAAEPGPEWPLSTQLGYTLTGHYRGPVSGTAQVQWIRQGRRYQVHLDIDIGPLISRRMSSDGVLTPEGIAPERYDEETKVLLRERRQATIRFEREARLLRLPQGAPQALPAGVQDAASQFVQLTWLFLTGRETPRAGRVIEMPLALPRRLYGWRYEVLGEEQLQTPMGPLDAWHLVPRVDRPVRSNDLSAEVWVAPALQYLPVRLRIVQDEQNYLDLMLKSVPLQAAQ
ncbi:MAG TPA: DUF3108 domain-containing protein, partial [Roseateles sp.]|nr:DUF3108 domain-containing protein [Roseateles sp.]